MNDLKLFKNISLFTFFNVLNSIIPFLLLPILTTYLTPEDYGVVDIFYNIFLIATPVVGLSIVQSIGRFYFEDIQLSRFISTVFVILALSGIVMVLVAFLISLTIGDLFRTYDIPPMLLVLAMLYTLFSQVSEILLSVWRVSYKTVKFGLFRILKTAADLGLSILLVVVFEMGWEGRIMPQLIVAFLFAGISVYILIKKGQLVWSDFDKTYKKEALAFSVPLIFHTLANSLIGFSDRFFILVMLGLSNVGVYSVGYQIGMVVALLQNSFNQAWIPFFFEKLKEDKMTEKIRIVKITYVYFMLLLLVVVFFYLLNPLIYTYFIGDAFASGANVVIWVLLGYAFQGMYKMSVNYLFYVKKTRLIAYCTIGTMMVNLLLNYFLIKLNGAVGAAQATFITFVFLFLLVSIVAHRYYKMPWNLKAVKNRS